MKITSVFNQGEMIPAKYTCDGDNINPPLEILEVPEQAKSLVLIMFDPDVPKTIKSDGNWDHWLAWNIPVSTSLIPEGQNPQGIIGKNTSGQIGYTGPCPPDKEHRYFFKLYALDCELSLIAVNTRRSDLEKAMQDHILTESELMGVYNRS